MTTGKKIIKYLSMAFAIFLTFTIISGITNGIYSLISVFSDTSGNGDVRVLWNNDNTNINTGAGSFTIVNGNINDLDLDVGVGKTNITSMITGNSTIDIGIGSLSLNLIGNNYTFKVNKGIGKVVIDNKEVSDNEVLGMGSNTIKLNGGIGDTTVTLNKDR